MISSSPSRPPPSDEQIQLKLNSPSPVIPSSPRSLRPPNQLSLQTSSSSGEEDCSDTAQSPSRLNHLPLSVISEADDSDSDADSIAPINENNSQQLSQHSTDRPNPVHGVTGVHLRASLEDRNRMMDHSAVKSGYLMKKGERRKAWKKRWFVLRGGQVAMYKNDKEYQLLRLIPLSEIHACAPIELKKHSFTFGIVTPQRTYYVQAASAAEVKEWCQNVESAKEEVASRGTVTSLDLTPTTTAISPLSAPARPSPTLTPSPLITAAIPIPSPTPINQAQPYPSSSLSSTNLVSPISSSVLSNSSNFSPSNSYTTNSTAPTIASSLTHTAPTPRVPPNSYAGAAGLGWDFIVDVEGVDAGLTRARMINHGETNYGARGTSNSRNANSNVISSSIGNAASSVVGSRGRERSDSQDGWRRGDAPVSRNGSASRPTARGSGEEMETLSPSISDLKDMRRASFTSASASGGGSVSGVISSSEEEDGFDSYDNPPPLDSTAGVGLGAAIGARKTTFSELDRSQLDAHAAKTIPNNDLAPTPIPLTLPTTSTTTTASASTSTSKRTTDVGVTGFGDPNQVILAGYLMKQGKRKNWRKRWFVLMSSRLVYSRSHMDTKVHREISVAQILDAIEYDPAPSTAIGSPLISNASVHDSNNNTSGGPHAGTGGGASASGTDKNYQHCFKIITPKRTYLVCSPSEEDEIKWLSALQCLTKRKLGPLPPNAPSTSAAATTTSFSPDPNTNVTTSPPVTNPAPKFFHGRQRSLTDAARSAVKEVERRFHPTVV